MFCFSDLNESTMMPCGLSVAFLEAVTALQRGGENGYGKEVNTTCTMNDELID